LKDKTYFFDPSGRCKIDPEVQTKEDCLTAPYIALAMAFGQPLVVQAVLLSIASNFRFQGTLVTLPGYIKRDQIRAEFEVAILENKVRLVWLILVLS